MFPAIRRLKDPLSFPAMASPFVPLMPDVRDARSRLFPDRFMSMSDVFPILAVPVPVMVPPANLVLNWSIFMLFGVPERARVASAASIPEKDAFGEESLAVIDGFEAGPFTVAVPFTVPETLPRNPPAEASDASSPSDRLKVRLSVAGSDDFVPSAALPEPVTDPLPLFAEADRMFMFRPVFLSFTDRLEREIPPKDAPGAEMRRSKSAFPKFSDLPERVPEALRFFSSARPGIEIFGEDRERLIRGAAEDPVITASADAVPLGVYDARAGMKP